MPGLMRVLLLVGGFLAASSSAVLASHYKGGQITYEDKGNGTYLVTFKSYWRSNAVGSVNPTYADEHTKDSNLFTISYTVLPDGTTTEVVQQQTVTWAKPGLHTISWTSCCRLRGGSNFPEGSIGLFAAVNYDPAAPSSSPQFYDLPLFNFTAGVPLSFSFNSADPDEHSQEYALSTPYGTQDNLYDRMIATGFSISDKGAISWTNPQKGIWLVNVKLSEKINGQLTGAFMFRDFMLYVNESPNTAPVFESVTAKMISEENQLLFEVRATDAEGQAVKLQAAGVPLSKGASFEQTTFGSASAGVFSWTPPVGARGVYTVQFIATDNASFPLSSQINVQIEVTVCTPQQLVLASIGEVCANSPAFALESPFAGGTFSGPGMTGNVFSPALAGVGTHVVTCTYTEGSCTHQSTQEIVVVPAKVADAGPDHKIYTGYGRTAYALLEGKATGNGPLTFKWSTGATEPTLKVWPTVTTTYTLSVTDATGCSATDEVTVFVENISCGNNNDKVLVCHNGKTICIAPQAVAAHLAIGAYLGPCDSRPSKPGNATPSAKEMKIAHFSVYPNPFQGQKATVEFVLEEKSAYAVDVYNLQGVRVARLEEGVAEAGQVHKVAVDVSSLTSGLYLTKLSAGNQVKYLKVVNMK
jgi:hypothetical protein